jgi:hypothetical protein
MVLFFTILNDNDYMHIDNLYIYNKVFNANNGFCLSSAKNLNYLYYHNGYDIAIVEIPYDEPNLKIIKSFLFLRTNMFILKYTYHINNLQDFKHLININDNLLIIIKIHNINILNWLHTSKYNLSYYVEQAINYASSNGHDNVLEWFKNSGYYFKFTKYTLYYASSNGHVNILEWFNKSGYKFKYNIYSIYYASKNGHVKVLNWFKKINYKFKYSNQLIMSSYKNINVLKWFKNNCFKIKHSYYKKYEY